MTKRREENVIHVVHHSLKGFQRTPRNMARMPVSWEQRDTFTKIAISIFTDCSNVGVGFQDALLAIYLSGLQHGSSIATGEAA